MTDGKDMPHIHINCRGRGLSKMTEKKTKRIQIRLTDEVYRRLKVIAGDNCCTMTDVIEGLINDYYMASIVFIDEENAERFYPCASLLDAMQ